MDCNHRSQWGVCWWPHTHNCQIGLQIKKNWNRILALYQRGWMKMNVRTIYWITIFILIPFKTKLVRSCWQISKMVLVMVKVFELNIFIKSINCRWFKSLSFKNKRAIYWQFWRLCSKPWENRVRSQITSSVKIWGEQMLPPLTWDSLQYDTTTGYWTPWISIIKEKTGVMSEN